MEGSSSQKEEKSGRRRRSTSRSNKRRRLMSRRRRQRGEDCRKKPSDEHWHSPTRKTSTNDRADRDEMSCYPSDVPTPRLYFPDYVLENYIIRDCSSSAHDDENDNDSRADVVSEIFFELANTTEIAYRPRTIDSKKQQQALVFQQDHVTACGAHTGGIIWETSYLLLQYLLQQQASTSKCFLGRTLELGAGVGFLGQCLAASRCCKSMILTETPQVLVNLKANWKRNQSAVFKNTDDDGDDAGQVAVCALDWTSYEKDAADDLQLQPHGFDTLLGTDILFAPHLVVPLLQTAAFLSHDNTIWYLCVQIRCAVSHTLFLEKAPKFGFAVQDISETAFAISECAWSKALDCFLFRITRVIAQQASK